MGNLQQYKNGLLKFDTVFEAVQELDNSFGREQWMNNLIGDCYIGDILVIVSRGLRFDPITDEQYDKFNSLCEVKSLTPFNIRLS